MVLRCLCLFLVLVFAGCGDDDSSSPAATPTPTAVPATATLVPTATSIPTSTTPPSPTLTATLPPSPTRTSTVPPSPTSTAVVPATATATDSPLPSATPTATASATPAEPTPILTGSARIRGLTVDQSFELEGLESAVHIVRTASNVPYLYAENRRDLAFAQGFTIARDRYFMMDLTRRLGLGKTSELIGDGGLDVDLESRLTGMTFIADRITNSFSEEQGAMADAFAGGVNAYIKLAAQRRLPLPSELRLAAALLGATNPAQLMVPFTRRDIGAILAVIMYQSSYETGDVGRDRTFASIGNPFAGAPLESERLAGLQRDVLPSISPVHPVASSAGLGLETGDELILGPTPAEVPGAQWTVVGDGGAAAGGPSPASAELVASLDAFERRLGRVDGFGSNSWAVAGDRTASGATLVAGDGHLSLDVPPIFFQIGLDTSLFGGGDIHQVGLVIPGFFVMPVGSNGDVAWCQTQLSADITDWYRERLQLDAAGLPVASYFRGEWKPINAIDESFVVADVPALDSEGRTETWARFVLFDGRFLTDVEGRSANADTALAPGESLVNTLRGLVVPQDLDSDGVISGISFDYSGLDTGRLLDGADGFGRAKNMDEFRAASRNLIAYSQNVAAGDKHGNILYTSYHAVPCRGYLPRKADGSFVAGADPRRLLDGTQYGGFEIPMTDGRVDESASGGDPARCLVPFDSTPQALNPERGYVLTANNDPGALSYDDSLENDDWYIGGPWESGFRASTIDRTLAALVGNGTADLQAMADLQGNHQSRTGELLVPYLLDAIAQARQLTMVDRILTPDEDRLAALYGNDSAALDEVEQRLRAWGDRGYHALSGVETFYHTPAPGEADDAVATMIHNAWFGRFVRGVWGDENFDGGYFADGDHTRVKLIRDFLQARDQERGRPASFVEATGESAFFDNRNTPEIERSREIMLLALADGLTFLRSAPTAPDRGGFGTNDMSQWIWGLRHQARFESLLAPFLGNDPTFEVFTRPFNIDTSKLPLAPNLTAEDPRASLRWFPRPGDQWGVDAANPGLSGTDFTHGSGPVMRMAFALKEGEFQGLNIIPGGQSGLTESPFLADQAALWLANEALPVYLDSDDVADHSTGHEVLRPGGCRNGEECAASFGYCQDPDGTNALSSCGICIDPENFGPDELGVCASDAECTATGEVCDLAAPSRCFCTPTLVCQAGCESQADCHTGQTCSEVGHCVATACSSDTDCPATYTCGEDDAGAAVCQRRTCTADGECGNGACVNGACHDRPGTCAPFGV